MDCEKTTNLYRFTVHTLAIYMFSYRLGRGPSSRKRGDDKAREAGRSRNGDLPVQDCLPSLPAAKRCRPSGESSLQVPCSAQNSLPALRLSLHHLLVPYVKSLWMPSSLSITPRSCHQGSSLVLSPAHPSSTHKLRTSQLVLVQLSSPSV
jgi:hypothetical protein